MLNRRRLLVAVAVLLASCRISAADPLSLNFGVGANPVPVVGGWQYTYNLTLTSIAGTFERMTAANTLTVGPFAGFVSAGAPAGWVGALIAGNLVYTPTATHEASGGAELTFAFNPISIIGPIVKAGSWAASYTNNSGAQIGSGAVPVPTPEPWNVLSLAMLVPVGLLYWGLRRPTTAAVCNS